MSEKLSVYDFNNEEPRTTQLTTPVTAKLAEALSKAQAKIEKAIKDSDNPYFRSKYADLTSVWDACRSQLTENGLSVIQMPGKIIQKEGLNCIEMTTLLLHSSGEMIRGTMEIPVKELSAQSIGSAITYGRRYALAAMVGVAPEDDDGNAATQPQKQPWSTREQRTPPSNFK